MKLITEQISDKGSTKPHTKLTFEQLTLYVTKLQNNPEELKKKKAPLEHVIIASFQAGDITAEEKNTLLQKLSSGKMEDKKAPLKEKKNYSLVPTQLKMTKKHLSIVGGGILSVVLITGVLFSIYSSRANPEENGNVQGTSESVYSEQVLRFKGILYDRNGQPIQEKVDVRFAIYDSATGENAVYSGECYGENGLTPDQTGSFSIAIGLDCGMQPLPEAVLKNMKNTYLGITVGNNPELKPRYPIATVDHSKNADRIQGLSPGNNESTIPYIDQEGVFKIAAVSPVIQSTTGIFTLEGQSVVLQATDEENGSVVIGGPSGLGLQTDQILAEITVGGSISPDENSTYDLGSPTNYFASTYTSNLIVAEEGIGAYWQREAGIVSPTYIDDSLALGFVTGSKPTVFLSSSKNKESWVLNRAFGVGTATPAYLFTASGSVDNSSIVSLSNLSKSDKNLTNVLRLNLGGSNNNASFIDFYANATTDANGKKVGSIGMENGNLTFKTGGADFAEYMVVIEETEPGMIISATGAGNAKAVLDERPIGVVTDVAGIIGNYDAESERNSALVGLLGQVPTFVSTIQGDITAGGAIGVSLIPGYGQIAQSAQTVVGTVLASTEEIERALKNDYCPRSFRSMTDPNNNPIRCGRVNVLVSPQWFEPNQSESVRTADTIDSEYTTPGYTSTQINEEERTEVEKSANEEKTPLELYIERSKQMQRQNE